MNRNCLHAVFAALSLTLAIPALAQAPAAPSITVPPIAAPPVAPALPPAPTFSASHLALAAELVAIQRVVEQYANIGQVLTQQVEQGLTASNPLLAGDQQLRTAFREVAAAIEAEAAPERNKGILEFAVLVFAERFTEAELRQTIDFFSSPAGQKYLQAAPIAAQEIISGVNDLMRRVGPRLVERIRAEMRRRGHTI
jgi:uncharacterized protein